MITCDYCNTPITGGDAITFTSPSVIATTSPIQTLRVDLHPECAVPFRDGIRGIQGKRPNKGNNSPQ